MPVLATDPPSWPSILDLWRAADDIDLFESGWVFDHFSPAAVDASGPCFEAWTTMTALAQATSRLRVGTMVLAVARRHPALLAHMALTLDVISGGRIELGLGAGWSEADHQPQGIELGTPADRANRFDEACAALVHLLSGRTVTSCGRFTTLTEANCTIPPMQRPHLPICIGGNGEQRTLRTAARLAQHWNFPGKEVAVFARKRTTLLRYCAEIGRAPHDIAMSATVAGNPADPTTALEQAAAYANAGADLVIIRMRPPYRAAALERLAAALDPLATRAQQRNSEIA